MESELPTELIHRIQLLLSDKDAGRTCVLSKSCLHAWYTIPHLRFYQNKLIDNTLERYHHLNLPIQSLEIRTEIKNNNIAPLTRLIGQVTSKCCLKKISLRLIKYPFDMFTLLKEIFSGENLTTINVINEASSRSIIYTSISLCNSNNIIKCVSLRVLKLIRVNISEDLFNSLLSTCILLEKIELDNCNSLKIVKVKDLPRLRELVINGIKEDCVLEIDNVPSLFFFHYRTSFTNNNMINCVSLRVLKLIGVNISEEAFNSILSTCIMLEKILLSNCNGLETAKVKVIGLPFLMELKIYLNKEKNVKVIDLPCLTELDIRPSHDFVLEIDNVPSLGIFRYWDAWKTPLTLSQMDRIARVTQLQIHGLSIWDDEFTDMIKLKFLFLMDLDVGVVYWSEYMTKGLVITNATLKRLTLKLVDYSPNDVKVDAPNLVYFSYESAKIRTLLFPAVPPKQINLKINLIKPMDLSFFHKMREVLNLSSMFDIYIRGSTYDTLLTWDDTSAKNMRRRFLSPATNVKQLHIETNKDVWKHTLYYDLFFPIFHPSGLMVELMVGKADSNTRLFSKLMVRGILKNKKKRDLKNVQMRNSRDAIWEHLTLRSWKTFIDPSRPRPYSVDFKLEWFTQ